MNASLLRMLADLPDDEKPKTPTERMGCSVEGAIERLFEIYERFAKGNPFKPGDLVHPRLGFINRGNGEPHLVLITRPPQPIVAGDLSIGNAAQARPVDTYCINVNRDACMGFWLCSWELEPFPPV